MNTCPHSHYAPAGSSHTPGATAKLFEIAPASRAGSIISGIWALLRHGSSVIIRIFDGIAEQRHRQAKEIVAYYGHRQSDSLESAP